MITGGHFIANDCNCNPGLSIFCFSPKACLTTASDYGCAVTAVDAVRQIENFTSVLRLIFGIDSPLAKEWVHFTLELVPPMVPLEASCQIAKNPFFVTQVWPSVLPAFTMARTEQYWSHVQFWY